MEDSGLGFGYTELKDKDVLQGSLGNGFSLIAQIVRKSEEHFILVFDSIDVNPEKIATTDSLRLLFPPVRCIDEYIEREMGWKKIGNLPTVKNAYILPVNRKIGFSLSTVLYESKLAYNLIKPEPFTIFSKIKALKNKIRWPKLVDVYPGDLLVIDETLVSPNSEKWKETLTRYDKIQFHDISSEVNLGTLLKAKTGYIYKFGQGCINKFIHINDPLSTWFKVYYYWNYYGDLGWSTTLQKYQLYWKPLKNNTFIGYFTINKHNYTPAIVRRIVSDFQDIYPVSKVLFKTIETVSSNLDYLVKNDRTLKTCQDPIQLCIKGGNENLDQEKCMQMLHLLDSFATGEVSFNKIIEKYYLNLDNIYNTVPIENTGAELLKEICGS